MGLIKHYSLTISKSELQFWLDKGWEEAPKFDSKLDPMKTTILGKPKTLSNIKINTLIGKTIVNYGTNYGTYGMGGPGFLGFKLDSSPNTENEHIDGNIMVYAVWGASQYTLIDDRVIECNYQFYSKVHPWISKFSDENIPNWDDLGIIILGSQISDIKLTDNNCTIYVSKEGHIHTIEFLRNDPRLPLQGNGQPRSSAFALGSISNFIVFQQENAILHV